MCGCHGDSHASHSLVEPRVVRQRGDLCVRELGVFLDSSQLIDLKICEFHLLLRVDHLHLQLREGLQTGGLTLVNILQTGGLTLVNI